jgi:hypothetical protein
MEHSAVTYEIRVEGHLNSDWEEWFGGLVLTYTETGETILTGPLRDQSALYGVLMRMRDLGLTLISVGQVEPREKT